MKRYAVSEVFHTLQGEGRNAGRVAVFVRFAGCNLWTGKERDRVDAVCQFCDVPALEVAEAGVAGRTTFAGTAGPGGGSYTAGGLVEVIDSMGWAPLVVLTGGEPSLQVDADLVERLRELGYEVAMETNGTREVEPGLVDWLTVSPKAGARWAQRRGDELKLVYPQPQLMPAAIERVAGVAFGHYYLQPMEPVAGPDHDAAWEAAVEATKDYVLGNPRWRLSLQTHKLLGIA